MSFIAFIFKSMVKLIVLAALLIGAVFAYTSYAKTYGIVKFKNGGYLVFDAPEDSYILEQSKIMLRIATGASNYAHPASVIDGRCDEQCVLEEKSPGITGIDTQPLNAVPNNCSGGQPVNLSNINKRTIICAVSGSTYTSLSAVYEVAPGKIASVVMGSSRQVAGHDPNFINTHQRYIAEIINSSNYRKSIWPTFGWVRNFLPTKGDQP